MFIRRIAPFSFAKNLAAVFFGIGVLSAFIRVLEWLYAGMASWGTGAHSHSAGGILYGLFHLSVLQVFYALVSFVIGLVASFLYNRVSAVIGPIEVDLSESGGRRSHRKAPEIAAPVPES